VSAGTANARPENNTKHQRKANQEIIMKTLLVITAVLVRLVEETVYKYQMKGSEMKLFVYRVAAIFPEFSNVA
jgi:hypothetical protein